MIVMAWHGMAWHVCVCVCVLAPGLTPDWGGWDFPPPPPQQQQCGSIMYAAPAGGADVAYLKVGLIDDVDFVNRLGAPKMEIYCKHLWSWEKTFDGAKLIQS